jgi:adenosylcobinamide-phosphate synthase
MLSGLHWHIVALLLLAGVVLDLVLGEPRRWHPLIGFGKLANAIERLLNVGRARIARGVTGWLLAVAPLTILSVLLCQSAIGLAAHAVLLYLCIGLRSLREHNLPIAAALRNGDLPVARKLTGRIVSRDTADANESELAKASAESLLENGNDAVFGTLFWFAVAGGPGAVLFRLANTLDAMWGYRNPRFLYFGRFAARFDDVLNYIPARLTALSYLLLAPGRKAKQRALYCWRKQAPLWSSPNAGPVMSTGAGALGLALGGAAVYDGETEQRPALGLGAEAQATDIRRAWQLIALTTLLWLGLALISAVITFGAWHA